MALALLGSGGADAFRQKLTREGTPYVWRVRTLTVAIDLAEAPADAPKIAGLRRQLAIAADRWNQPSCSDLKFALVLDPASAAVTVGFQKPTSSVDGGVRAHLRLEPKTATISGANLKLSPHALLAPAAVLERQLTFAFGEVLGFGRSADPAALMHSPTSSSARAVLERDDVAALCSTYGVSSPAQKPGRASTPNRQEVNPVESPAGAHDVAREDSSSASTFRGARQVARHRESLVKDARAQGARKVVFVVAGGLTAGWVWWATRRRRRTER